MTEDEKQRLTEVLITADGGCSNCVYDIAVEMDNNFPNEDWIERVMLRHREIHPPAERSKPGATSVEDFVQALKSVYGKQLEMYTEGMALYQIELQDTMNKFLKEATE